MARFELQIKNKKGVVIWTEPFDTRKELNRWLANADKKYSDQKEFKVDIIDNSEAIEREEQERKLALEAEIKRNADARAVLSEFVKKDKVTVAEAFEALKLVIDRLGLGQPPPAEGFKKN